LKAAHLEHCGRLQQKYQHDAELLDDIRYTHDACINLVVLVNVNDVEC